MKKFKLGRKRDNFVYSVLWKYDKTGNKSHLFLDVFNNKWMLLLHLLFLFLPVFR